MKCEEIREHLEFYELGLLEEPELGEVRSHLAEGCDGCNSALGKARALNTMLLTAVEVAQPPARLRRRVIQTLVGRAAMAPWLSWAGYAMAASLALVLLWQGSRFARQERQLAEARVALDQAGAAQSELRETIQFLQDPVTQVTSSGSGPVGVYYLNARRGVLLIANRLQPLEPSKTYQMWVIPKGQNPRPAGLFQPRDDGSAVHRFETTLELGATAAVAVTIEPSAGSQAPTTTPFLVAPVGP